MKKTEYRAFNIAMPPPIIPIYDFLQEEMNSVLDDEDYRSKLQELDLTQHRGNTWKDMKNIFNPRVKTWKINNKAWYARILYENLRRELQSKEENIKIWNEYTSNANKINETLFNNLINKYNIYATRGRIESLVSSGKPPELTRYATFQLDYTISEKQMFRINPDNPYLYEIKIGNKPTDWVGYLINIPSSINSNFTGNLAKPRFLKRKSDGKYIGICSYEVAVNQNNFNNSRILGVDIGKVNLYSGIVLYKGEINSPQLLPSRKLCNLSKKLERLCEERNYLYLKNKRFEKYRVESKKQAERLEHYKNIRHKISNLTTCIARQIAYELVELAKEYKCKEIHIENLTWLKSQGKKWNHSEIFTKLEEVASLEGIKIVKVNAYNSSKENPITNEIGIADNRKIKFVDGTYIDRDLLASINLASRNKKDKKMQKVKKIKTPQKKRTRLIKSRKQEILNKIKNNRGVEIVAFRPRQIDIKTSIPWESLISQTVYTSCLKKGSSVTTCYRNYHLLQV